MASGGGDESPPPSPLGKDNIGIVLSPSDESRAHVEIGLKIEGMKPKGLLSKWWAKHVSMKGTNPSDMIANGEVKRWNITSTGLDISLVIATNRKGKKQLKLEKEGGEAGTSSSGQNLELFELKIRQFPCEIDPEDIRVDIRAPSSGRYAVIYLTFRKLDESANWNEFMQNHATLDAKPKPPQWEEK